MRERKALGIRLISVRAFPSVPVVPLYMPADKTRSYCSDSPAFNASAYYDDLISKSSLSGLMKTASSLSAGTPPPSPL